MTRACIICTTYFKSKCWNGNVCSHECRKASKRAQYAANRKDRCRRQKIWRDNNEDVHRVATRRWQEANKARMQESQKEYRKKNRNRISKLYRDKYTNDLNFKIAKILRNRVYIAIKNNQKAGSAIKDLGCTIPELKKHIELQFKPGMSWDNWGLHGWHIDHVKPLCKFNLTKKEQFKEACHYSNLQPLWAEENHSKGGKFCANV